MSAIAWVHSRAARARRSLRMAAGVGAVGAMLVCGALPAAGETAPPGGSGSAVCTSPNQPSTPTRVTKLIAGVGATQSTRVGTRFQLRLAVTATDAQGNPVPDVPVTFTAPVNGASGRFTIRPNSSDRARPRTSHPRRVEVRTDVCGVAVAPAFTANHRQGGYIVTASVEHARAAFALVNEGP